MHPALVAVVPILFLYQHNQTQAVPVRELAVAAAAAVGFAVVAWGLLALLYRDAGKAALVTSLVAVLVLSYGHFTMAVTDLAHRYTSLDPSPDAPAFLVPWAMLLAAGAWRAWRTRRDLAPVHRVLNVTTAGLAVISLTFIAIGSGLAGTAAPAPDVPDAPGTADPRDHPNVYYLVLDEYANTRVLSERHGFDNSAFEDALRERGFTIPQGTRANYAMTSLSLASTLNMRYLDDLPEKVGEDSVDLRVPYAMIHQSAVAASFKAHGYDVVHFDSGWAGTAANAFADEMITCGQLTEFERTLVKTTILHLAHARLVEEDMRERLDCQFNALADVAEARANASASAFVFTHVVSPHGPFVFDAHGNPVNGTRELERAEDEHATREALYLGQLRYVTARVLETVDAILEADPGAVIIVQSDHGTNLLPGWREHDPTFIQDRMRNFNALRLPDAPADAVPENFTNVNTFRIVLDAYLGTDHGRLPDRAYFSDPFRPYAFTDVTRLTTPE